MQISNLPDREFKVMVIKMHTKLGRMNEHKNFNRGKGNIKNDYKRVYLWLIHNVVWQKPTQH